MERHDASRVSVELLQLPGCPHVSAARQLLFECLADLGLPRASVLERVGDFPSPSILVNGVDVMDASAVHAPSCRLDVPTRERVLAALRQLSA